MCQCRTQDTPSIRSDTTDIENGGNAVILCGLVVNILEVRLSGNDTLLLSLQIWMRVCYFNAKTKAMFLAFCSVVVG